MPDLIASAPLADASAQHGVATLTVLPLVQLRWVAPYPGQTDALSAALHSALDISFPAPGTSARGEGCEIRWAGRDQALLFVESPSGLEAVASVTDVSGVYVRLLVGPPEAAADVLARLVPLDLRPARFAPGRTARSLLGHIPAHLTATEHGVEVMVMRSFAQTAFHEIEVAMEGLAGRAALG